MCMWHGKKTGVDNGEDRSTPAQIGAAAKDAGPALLVEAVRARFDAEVVEDAGEHETVTFKLPRILMA